MPKMKVQFAVSNHKLVCRLCHSFGFTRGAVLKGPAVLDMVTKIGH